MKHLKHWLLINLGLIVMIFTTAFILSANRGAGLYWQEFKEFKGAVSRASGGDWKETREVESRQDFIIEPGAEFDVSALSIEDKNKLIEELFADKDINDAALAPKNKRKS